MIDAVWSKCLQDTVNVDVEQLKRGFTIVDMFDFRSSCLQYLHESLD